MNPSLPSWFNWPSTTQDGGAGEEYEVADEQWVDLAKVGYKTENASPQTMARTAFAIAQVALQNGDLELADRWFAEASRHWPDWATPFNSRGKLATRRGDLDSAVRYFRSAINFSPNWLEPRTKLVGALLGLNRFNEVASEARQILSLNPNHAYSHYALAMAYGQLDRPEEAIRSAETALRLDERGSSGFNPDELKRSIEWWRSWIARSISESPVKINTGTVTSPDAYAEMRSRPGAGTEVLRIPQNTVISLQNCQSGATSFRGRSGNWCQTTYRGQTGWVFNGFVK